MKKIGYIYRYNESEGKGILVFGYNRDTNFIKFKPIKFSKKDCISVVKTGQLVYFNLIDDSTATQIDKVSLCNFNRELVSEIASCYETHDWNDCFSITHIRFENLEDDSIDMLEDAFNETCGFEVTSPKKNLPDSIDDLFSLFGTKQHFSSYELGGSDTILIDILDIKYWFDESAALSNVYYGKNADEILDLFDIFINKRRTAEEKVISQQINSKWEIDDCISPIWKQLLAPLSDEDLRKICKSAPMLQPALPHDFCGNNNDTLSIDYGFPDVSICEAYYRYRISNAESTSEYEFLLDKIRKATYCSVKHKNDEGVPPCKMGKDVLQKLEELLENQYRTVILNNVKQQLSSLSDNKIDGEQRVLSLLDKEDYNYLKELGHFIDLAYSCNDAVDFRYVLVDKVFENLQEEDRIYLETSIKEKYKKILMEMVTQQSVNDNAFGICFLIKNYPQYLSTEDFDEIKKIVNSSFAKLDDLEDLNSATDCGLITEKQNLERYQELLKDYNLNGFLQIIEHNYTKNIPPLTQSFIIIEIINKFNFKGLRSSNWVKIGYDRYINSLDSLISWFNDQCEMEYLDSHTWNNILKETTSFLCKEDRWFLFEKNLIPSPHLDNIREKLDIAYNNKKFAEIYFQKDCFQDVMLDDIQSNENIDFKLFVANHLDASHKRKLYDETDGVLKLYMWISNPNEEFDEKLIFSHFSELPAEQQIKLFRYIVFLNARGKTHFSVEELYDLLVKGKNKATSSICTILYVLKEKKANPSKEISSKMMLKETIGDGYQQIKELQMLESFFYPCNGPLAYTYQKRDRDYQTYYGYIDKTITPTKSYYTIVFYDTPHDVCDSEVNWLSNQPIKDAISILEINFNVKVVDGVANIDISHEKELKEFVIANGIDDHCCLLDSKYALIAKGYLPPNNSYQPLYTNYISPYDYKEYNICRDSNHSDIDPQSGLPFYWCNKKTCARRCHYLLPVNEWEKFKFSDILYILLGFDCSNLHRVWSIYSEISQFINDILESITVNPWDDCEGEQHIPQDIISHNINYLDEVGCLTEELSVVQNIDDDYLMASDDDEHDYDNNRHDSEEPPTYGRYRGSYAQDVMGYSDDDIDTIFDGDPSAYWNID